MENGLVLYAKGAEIYNPDGSIITEITFGIDKGLLEKMENSDSHDI